MAALRTKSGTRLQVYHLYLIKNTKYIIKNEIMRINEYKH